MENSTNVPEPVNEPQATPQSGFVQQKTLPNATAVLVLGIISIVTCWCWGIVGLTLGVIALILGAKSKKLYRENPNTYSEMSFKNLNAGFICAIVGVSLSGIWFLLFILRIIFFSATLGTLFNSFPWENFNF